MNRRSLLAATCALAIVLGACGTAPAPSPAATPAPVATASPTPAPTPLPPPATGSIPATGGTVAVPGGAALEVPAGALSAKATATITASAPTGSATDAWPADPAGPTWTVDLGGAALAKPVTLAIPFDPAALPAGTDPAELMLAYKDPATGGWRPVPAAVDPAAHTVTAIVDHLSVWGLFTINWDYWLGFIGKAASGNLTDLLGAFSTLTTACPETSGGFTVDNSATNGMLKGCVQKVTKGTATIGVTNMRMIAFGLSGGAVGAAGGSVFDPGDTVTFTAGGTKLAQPLVASASLSKLALGYQLTDLLLRLLPGSGVFTHASTYGKVLKAIAEEVSTVWSSAKILDKLQASPPDIAGAAEEAFSVVTGHSFLGAFAAAAIAAGRTFDVPYLSALTTARLNQVTLAVNLLVLDTTLLTWDVQYFIAGYGEIKVSWAVPPPAPTNIAFSDLADGSFVECNAAVADQGYCGKFEVTWKWSGLARSATMLISFGSAGFYDCAMGPCDVPSPHEQCLNVLKWAKPVQVATVDASAGRWVGFTPPPFGLPCFWLTAKNSVGSSKAVLAP